MKGFFKEQERVEARKKKSSHQEKENGGRREKIKERFQKNSQAGNNQAPGGIAVGFSPIFFVGKCPGELEANQGVSLNFGKIVPQKDKKQPQTGKHKPGKFCLGIKGKIKSQKMQIGKKDDKNELDNFPFPSKTAIFFLKRIKAG